MSLDLDGVDLDALERELRRLLREHYEARQREAIARARTPTQAGEHVHVNFEVRPERDGTGLRFPVDTLFDRQRPMTKYASIEEAEAALERGGRDEIVDRGGVNERTIFAPFSPEEMVEGRAAIREAKAAVEEVGSGALAGREANLAADISRYTGEATKLTEELNSLVSRGESGRISFEEYGRELNSLVERLDRLETLTEGGTVNVGGVAIPHTGLLSRIETYNAELEDGPYEAGRRIIAPFRLLAERILWRFNW